jgi:hypothetical protein
MSLQSPVPEVLYKYCPHERVDVLQNRKIAFTRGQALNDIFEMQPNASLQFPGSTTSPEEEERLVRETLEEAFILCLSDSWHNIPLWSYYAEGHGGFVIGLASAHPFFADLTLDRVQYEENYPVVDHKSGFFKAVFHKFKGWRHEQEWRCFHVPSEDGVEFSEHGPDVYLYGFDPALICEVILGNRIITEHRCEILGALRLAEYGHVKVYDAVPDRHAWKLQRQPCK